VPTHIAMLGADTPLIDPGVIDEAVRYAVKDAVATLTMDQPHNRNALTPALMAGLAYLVGRPLIHNRVSLILVLLASPLIYLAAAFPLSALTIEDLGYVLPLAERLPAWMPVRDRIVRLGRRPGANM